MIIREPIVLDMEGWARLAINATSENLRIHGPTIGVDIQGLGAETQGIRIDNVVALIDTGAILSCLSPNLAERLGIPSQGIYHLRAAGSAPENVSLFRCKLFYPGLVQVEADFAVLSHLADPHEVVIGRDLLHNTRLLINSMTGQWEIHFRIPGLEEAFGG